MTAAIVTPDHTFAGRADQACFWEAWVGAVLSRAGLHTLHEPFTVAAEVGRTRESYAQSIDLWVSTGDFEAGVPVEIKSRELKFSTAKDYPYGDILVCSQESWLRKWPGASATRRDFLFVSRITGNILWLPVSTPVTLGHETFDGKRGELHKNVKADKSSLRELSDFVEMVRGS